jgi:hypothetical protein
VAAALDLVVVFSFELVPVLFTLKKFFASIHLSEIVTNICQRAKENKNGRNQQQQ